MHDALLSRLLATDALAAQMDERLGLGGMQLISATSRAIDAPGYLSDLVGIDLTWSKTAPDVPASAVLKVSTAGFGREELPFYRTVAPRLNCAVIPQFFAGGVDEPTGRTWLLMEDLCDSHERPSQAPVPPTFEGNAQLVEALAQFHATGWGNDDLQGMGPSLCDRLRASGDLRPAAERLFDQVGDAAEAETRALYERWFHDLPALVERAERLEGKTLVHGDAHVWNWMLPRKASPTTPKLIDWDGWHIATGVWDLAYMMALQWDRNVRQRFESKLLDRYHAALTASGISGYSRDMLQEDYRFAVLLHLRTPVARFARNMSAYVWWPQLMRIQTAVEDLDCQELLT